MAATRMAAARIRKVGTELRMRDPKTAGLTDFLLACFLVWRAARMVKEPLTAAGLELLPCPGQEPLTRSCLGWFIWIMARPFMTTMPLIATLRPSSSYTPGKVVWLPKAIKPET